MKWAKLIKDKDLTGMTPQDKLRSFKLYDKIGKPSSQAIQKASSPQQTMEGIPPQIPNSKKGKKDIFSEWKTYPLGDQVFKRQAQKKYELFCGGWLQFYDQKVRKPKTDHTMFFEWKIKQKQLTIWITPPAKPGPNKYTIFLPMALDPPNPPPPPPPPRGK